MEKEKETLMEMPISECVCFKQAQEGQGQISPEFMHACHLSWTSVKVLTFSGVSSLVDETYRMADGLPGREPL